MSNHFIIFIHASCITYIIWLLFMHIPSRRRCPPPPQNFSSSRPASKLRGIPSVNTVQLFLTVRHGSNAQRSVEHFIYRAWPALKCMVWNVNTPCYDDSSCLEWVSSNFKLSSFHSLFESLPSRYYLKLKDLCSILYIEHDQRLNAWPETSISSTMTIALTRMCLFKFQAVAFPFTVWVTTFLDI